MKLDPMDDEDTEFAELEKRLDRLFRVSQLANESPDGLSIANYKVLNVLGRGAFGIVYLADDQQAGRKVALKVPRPEVLVTPDKISRFIAEASLAATLDHPGVVEVYDVELTGPTPHIAAAYCNGPNLAEWLQACDEPPEWRASVRLVAKIADALDYAHQKGIAHRDLKPANIMLVSAQAAGASSQDNGPAETEFETLDECDPKITDFGLAKLADPSTTDTRSSLLVGTPCYMAPERLDLRRRTDDGVAGDIYSLGVVLFELLTQQLPIEGNSYFELLDNIRDSSPRKLRKIRNSLPRSVAKICASCLAKNPQARYHSAAALAEELRKCAADQPVWGQRTSWWKSAAYWCSQPARMKTAGSFTFGCQMLNILYVTVAGAGIWAFDIITWDEYLGVMAQVAVLVFLLLIPMCCAGWLAAKGNRRAAWLALVLTMLGLPLALVAILYKPLIFQPLYQGHHAYFSFAIHAMPLFGFIAQALLLSCGLAATRPSD